MRLIDADVAYKVLAEYYHHRTETQYEALKEALSKVPTVNAEPVIRCKDCKHWGADGYRNACKYATCIMMENDYCSWAERKEDE